MADLRGREGGAPPWGSKFFQFHAVLEKFGKIVCWHPPESWRAPRRNLGSATVHFWQSTRFTTSGESRISQTGREAHPKGWEGSGWGRRVEGRDVSGGSKWVPGMRTPRLSFHTGFGKKKGLPHPLWKLVPPIENPGSANVEKYTADLDTGIILLRMVRTLNTTGM